MKRKRIFAILLTFLLACIGAWMCSPPAQAEEGTGETFYDYEFPCRWPWEYQKLEGEEIYIDRTMAVNYQDESAPEVAITNVSLEEFRWNEQGNSVAADSEKNPIFKVEKDEEFGWKIYCASVGWAKVTITYKTVTGEAASHEFNIYSFDDYYRLDLLYPQDTDCMLQNSAMEVNSRVVHRYLDKNGEHREEEVSDYQLCLDADGEGNAIYDTDLVNIEIDGDGKQFTVTSNSNNRVGGTQTYVYAQIPLGEEGQEEENLAEAVSILTVNVCESYYNIEPVELENPLVGETLDLSALGDEAPALYRYYKDDKGREQKDSLSMDSDTHQLRMVEYDNNIFEPTGTEEDLIPTLVRKNTEGGSIRLVAEEKSEEGDNWHEITSRQYYFDGLDYSTWLCDLQGEEYGWGHGWIYSNQDEQVYPLNRSNLEDKTGYHIEFELGTWEGEEENRHFIPFTSEAFEEQERYLFKYETEGSKVTGIKLLIPAIKTVLESMEEDNNWFDIRLRVFAGDENVEVYEDSWGIELRFGGAEYDLPEEEYILPDWNYDIAGTVSGRQYGVGLPEEGQDFNVDVIDVQVDVTEGDPYDFTLEKNDEGGWTIHTDGYGCLDVSVTYEKVDNPSETETHVIHIYVQGEVWEMDMDSVTGTDQLCPGETMTLKANVMLRGYNENTGHYNEIPKVEYVWKCREGAALIKPLTTGNSDLCEIEAREGVERDNGSAVGIRCTAYLLDENDERVIGENGDDIVFGEREFWLTIVDGYYSIDLDSDPNVTTDSDIEVEQTTELKPVLTHSSDTTPIDENEYTISAEWDSNALTITDSNKNPLTMDEDGKAQLSPNETYTITRIGDWNTDLHLWAYMGVNEKGEPEEVAYRRVRFSERLYDIAFEKLRAGDYTRVFNDETNYTLSLDTTRIAGKGENGLREGLSIDWKLRYWNENENKFEELTGLPVGALNPGTDENYNTVTLNGTRLSQIEVSENWTIQDEGGIELQALVKCAGVTVRDTSVWVEVREPEEYLEGDERSETTIGLGWSYDPDAITYYILDKDHPEGETFTASVEKIICENAEEENGEPVLEVRLEDGKWNIYALRNGTANVTFTISYQDGEKQVTDKIITRKRSVVGEQYLLTVWTDTDTDCLVPGQSLNLVTQFDKETYNADTGQRVRETISPNDYGVTFTADDTNIINVYESGRVTAIRTGNTEVKVEVQYGDITQTEYQQIQVVKQYAKMISDTLYLEPGDSFTLADTKAQFALYDRGHLEGEEQDANEILLMREYLDDCFTVDSYGKITVKADFVADSWPYETGINVKGRLGDDINEHYCKVVICKHSWTEKIIKEADCTNSGTKKLTCEYCDQSKEETIPAKGHTEVKLPAVPATETKEGLTEGKKCSVCGTIIVAQTVVPKLPAKEQPSNNQPTNNQPSNNQPPKAEEHTHSYTYVSNNDATVLKDGTKTGTCSCGDVVTAVDEGTKLAPVLQVPATNFPLKVGQSYSGFKVTMGLGDSIASVQSSNTKLVKISGISGQKGTFNLKAQKKTGKATVTIQLASGATKKLVVTVQKKNVKTTKISGLKNLTLKKGKKETLIPLITPITSKDKVTYTSSNKKVATVTGKGVVKGIKKGSAKITVKSGSKKKVIKVTVK